MNRVKQLPAQFSVRAPDDAMAPAIVRGNEVFIDTEVEPRHGDIVLVSDAQGRWWIREFLVLECGDWQASPLAACIEASVLSAAAGATVVGVCDGIHGRRSGTLV